MMEKYSDIDAAIYRVLLTRPGATPAQIKGVVRAASGLTSDDLASRVERLRSKLIRTSVRESRGRSSYD